MPARVVLAHADEVFLQDAHAALQAEALTVAPYTGSMEALKAMESAEAVELLVVSINFPGHQPNGVSLALMTKRRRPNVKIIFIGEPSQANLVDDLGHLLPPWAKPAEIAATAKMALM
ncbi:MAG: hypothetical protein JSS43_15830 [Proteobacteria bacterium]|nr:hypothetical protein [Pseudomonadota bacterium]